MNMSLYKSVTIQIQNRTSTTDSIQSTTEKVSLVARVSLAPAAPGGLTPALEPDSKAMEAVMDLPCGCSLIII